MVAERTILLIEDDPEGAFFMRYVLKRFARGYQMVHFSSAITAIEYLQAQQVMNSHRLHPLPDLILIDLKMPGMDGFEFLAWLRSQPELASLPACILTGSTYPPYAMRARELGADAYLVKPADLSDFVACLKGLLEKLFPESEPPVLSIPAGLPRRNASLAA